jgi:hypothetical protein
MSTRDLLLRDMQDAHDAKDWKLYWEIQAAIEQIDQRDDNKKEWDGKMKGKVTKQRASKLNRATRKHKPNTIQGAKTNGTST